MMKTIYFTNRERIMIGDDHIQYMTYLQKKLPGSRYDISDELLDVRTEKKKPFETTKNRYLSQQHSDKYQ